MKYYQGFNKQNHSFRSYDSERLATLASYCILDTLIEPELDALTQLALQVSGRPTGLITFLDEHKQWCKSCINTDPAYRLEKDALCEYTIQSNDTFEIEDATVDVRFDTHSLIHQQGLVAYCGLPLISPAGYRLGSLCVVDYKPGRLTASQKQALHTIADMVIDRLELRRGRIQLQAEQVRAAQTNTELTLKNAELQMSLEKETTVNEQLQQANQDTQALMQQQLLLSEQKFEQLFESITEMFFSLDKQFQCVHWNRTCEVFTGIPASFTIGKNIYQIFPQWAGGRSEATLRDVLTSGVPTNYDFHYREKNQYFNVQMFPSITGVSVLVIDITENKQKQQELQELNQQLTERNFELDQIIYQISHDIRSPLASLLGLLHILKLEPLTEEVLQYVGLMENRISKLDRFTQSVLDFLRITRMQVQLEAIDFTSLMKQCRHDLVYLTNCYRLTLHLYQHGQPIYSDLVRMRIIFQNLMANAIKYQHPARKNPYLTITILNTDEECSISFEDNGLGIALEHQPHIFKMFYRASQQAEGSGLGTYIVKKTVEKLGGQISLMSKLGEGTSFTLRLPNLKKEIASS